MAVLFGLTMIGISMTMAFMPTSSPLGETPCGTAGTITVGAVGTGVGIGVGVRPITDTGTLGMGVAPTMDGPVAGVVPDGVVPDGDMAMAVGTDIWPAQALRVVSRPVAEAVIPIVHRAPV